MVDDSPPTTDDSVRSAVSTETPIPDVPVRGVHDVEVDFDEVFPYLDRHVLFKLHWGGRGVKGEAWRKIVEGDGEEEGFAAKLDRMWAEQDYLHPRARIGYFPCNADGNELVIFDPDDHDPSSSASSSRASPSTTGSASATSSGRSRRAPSRRSATWSPSRG